MQARKHSLRVTATSMGEINLEPTPDLHRRPRRCGKTKTVTVIMSVSHYPSLLLYWQVERDTGRAPLAAAAYHPADGPARLFFRVSVTVFPTGTDAELGRAQ